ncbi:MAG: hypothetical protein E7358_00300 [Clostridiales bacterium]|nr:hypothetical protein [Clostridiales bacterium]
MFKKFVKTTLLIFLSFVMMCNAVACDFAGEDSGGGSWWDDAMSDLEDWWGDASIDLEDWWGNASSDLENWWEDVSATGGDIAAAIDDKFNQLAGSLKFQKDKIVDDIATKLAEATYNSYNENNIIPLSSRSFEHMDISSLDEDSLNAFEDDLLYDEEAFVYQLIIALMPTSYDVFIATTENSAGEVVYGLAYTDYSRIYKNSEGIKYSLSGFITLNGEAVLTESELSSCKEIIRKDGAEDDEMRYVYAYQPESYTTHCVALNKYFIFGVDSNAQITYTCEPYSAYKIRSDLGDLYSFDQNKIIYNSSTNSHFTNSECYTQIKNETRSLKEIKQDFLNEFKNYELEFSSIDIASIFTSVKNTITQIFSEKGIANAVSSLTLNDIFSTNIFTPNVPSTATEKEKWVVGVACVVVSIITVAITIKKPQASSTAGAIAGAAIEVLLEVVMQNQSVESLDYRKVALAAVAGALSANLGIVGDSFVGGVTEGLYSLIDGEDVKTALESFSKGCLTGIALGVTFKCVGKLLGGVVNSIRPKLRRNVSNFVNDADIYVGGKKATVMANASSDIAEQTTQKAVRKINVNNKQFREVFEESALKQLPSLKNANFEYITKNGSLSAKKLRSGFLNITPEASDAIKKASVNMYTGEKVTKFTIKNWQVDFSELNAPSVKIGNMTTIRKGADGNFRKADILLAKNWGENPSLIPPSIRNYFENIKGWKTAEDFLDLDAAAIANMRTYLQLTWHEANINGLMQLIPMQLHSAVGHVGAVGALKIMQCLNNRTGVRSYVCKFMVS